MAVAAEHPRARRPRVPDQVDERLAAALRRLEEMTAAMSCLAAQLAELTVENERLTTENAALNAENGVLRRVAKSGGVGRETLLKELLVLRKQVVALQAELAEVRRAGKRSAAPFRRKHAKVDPKRPGRKPGHPGSYRHAPDGPPDETRETRLECCPDCKGGLTNLRLHESWVFEPIIVGRWVKYISQSGRCGACKRTVRSRHP